MIVHGIHARLYPNYLANGGAYIARAKNQSTLTIEDVCTILKTRGGFTGRYEDLMEHVKQYYQEVIYQLCDGYAVTNGYFTIHPCIGGTFNSVNEVHDSKKHPVSLRFGTRAKLQQILKKVDVKIEEIADGTGFIDEFRDFEDDSINDTFTPGNQFAIHGNKIKLAGDDPSVGLFFVSTDDPACAVKVERIAENSATRVTGIIPEVCHKHSKLEIRTQFTGTNNPALKNPRTITSSFVIEVAS